jgi:hypothetical protein
VPALSKPPPAPALTRLRFILASTPLQIRELVMQTQPSPEALRAVFAKLAGDADRTSVLIAMLDGHPGVWSAIARSLLARVPVSLIVRLACEAMQVGRLRGRT